MAKKAPKIQSAPTAAPASAPVEEKTILPIVPIWRDEFYELPERVTPYKIKVDNAVVFMGLASPKPDGGNSIRLNDVVANYLSQSYTSGVTKAMVQVSIAIDDTESYVQVANFVHDWGYSTYRPRFGIYTESIDRRLSPRQKVIFSATLDKDGVFKTTSKDGVIQDYPISQLGADKVANYFFPRLGDSIRKVSINGNEFEVTDGCEDCVLYYVNAHGGWDSLLIQRAVRTDDITRHTHKTEYNNQVTISRGKRNNLNEITRTYTLHTGLMTGDMGSRMHNLIESTLVIMHDLKANLEFPVIITDSQMVVKDYKNNGNKLFEYTINVEVARDYMRK